MANLHSHGKYKKRRKKCVSDLPWDCSSKESFKQTTVNDNICLILHQLWQDWITLQFISFKSCKLDRFFYSFRDSEALRSHVVLTVATRPLISSQTFTWLRVRERSWFMVHKNRLWHRRPQVASRLLPEVKLRRFVRQTSHPNILCKRFCGVTSCQTSVITRRAISSPSQEVNIVVSTPTNNQFLFFWWGQSPLF